MARTQVPRAFLSFACGLVVLLADPSSAAQTFTSEAAFLAALGGTPTVHDYDALAHNLTLTTQLTGVSYQSTVRAWNAATQGGGGTYHTAVMVGFNFGSAAMDFLMTPPVDGVGLYNTSIHDAERVTFYDAANNQLFQADLPSASVNFRGYIGDVKIARVTVIGIPPTNGTIFIDTLTFGDLGQATPTRRSSWGRIKDLYSR